MGGKASANTGTENMIEQKRDFNQKSGFILLCLDEEEEEDIFVK